MHSLRRDPIPLNVKQRGIIRQISGLQATLSHLLELEQDRVFCRIKMLCENEPIRIKSFSRFLGSFGPKNRPNRLRELQVYVIFNF